jgi:hypothetical protein
MIAHGMNQAPKSCVIGELPITLTRPDRSVIQQQKTLVWSYFLSSIVLCWNVSIDRGPYPPVYSICLFNDRTDFCRVV